ncbi:MAG TPA: 4,5-DOPA dioxygenase extradiol [Bacteroidales bacterium]|nr:4,5-DOPA dioxygenase extradiol [Bacteroidales bacterium]
MKRQPVLFLGHGSPMNAIEENSYVEGFRNLSAKLNKPKAILCISAHWESFGTKVTMTLKPSTIHDFGGFPKELFDVQYPAPGSPELAEEIIRSVVGTTVHPDHEWGLDHGCWSVVKHLYPEADVPVVQLSIDYRKTPAQHIALAKELTVFRDQNVLIIGSGNLVHNLRTIAWDRMQPDSEPFDWATEANEGMKKFILNFDLESLSNITSFGQSYQLAVPTPEHFLPILYVLGACSADENLRLFNDSCVGGSLSMTSVVMGL